MSDTKKKLFSLDEISKIDAELAKEILDYRAKEAAGLLEFPRRTYKECRSWREAWIYIFHRAGRDHSNRLKSEGERVSCAVWVGRNFDDKIVGILEKIASHIGLNNDIIELRLIDTDVSADGVERLKDILPKAAIKSFSRKESKKDQRIQYVNTDIEWIKKLYERREM